MENKKVKQDVKNGRCQSPLSRFRKWMNGRGGIYKNLKVKFYQDGEPYFSYADAEMSLSDFLEREDELTFVP